MTEMTTLRRAPHAIAEDIVREWLVDFRVRLDPHVATQLVSRIEAGSFLIGSPLLADRRYGNDCERCSSVP